MSMCAGLKLFQMVSSSSSSWSFAATHMQGVGVCADMLLVHRLPEWPAAATVLVRFVAAVSGPRGLKHGDNIVRQCCVDLLGVLVPQLYFEACLVEQERPWLCQVTGAPSSTPVH